MMTHDFYRYLRPILFRLPPEAAHQLSVWALRSVRGWTACPDAAVPAVEQDLFGLRFSNPLGLAAGYDKDAAVPSALARLGFGFVEVGTVTPRPQSGNPRPRLFRLTEDRALINRLGFNNEGAAAMARRLARRSRSTVIGANLGANRDSSDRAADYVSGLETLYSLADYFVVNVSSPNTPGLRELQGPEALEALLGRVLKRRAELAGETRPKPLLLKVAPDLSPRQCSDIAALALAQGIDGLVVGNTTIAREGLRSPFARETGGLSGAPLFARSTAVLRDFYSSTEGRLPLIGVGGIGSGADAYCKIRAGASLIQLYTALVYEGPVLVRRIRSELASLLRRDGLANIRDAVGLDVR